MSPQRAVAVMAFAAILAPTLAAAQINFPEDGYYAGLGDSVAAGEGALPVTSGYVYDLLPSWRIRQEAGDGVFERCGARRAQLGAEKPPCPALDNVTILVSNYYSIPHPVPLCSPCWIPPCKDSIKHCDSGSSLFPCRRDRKSQSSTSIHLLWDDRGWSDRTEVGLRGPFQFRRSPDKRRSRLHRETVRGRMAERELSDPSTSPSPSVPSLSRPRRRRLRNVAASFGARVARA